MAWRYTQIIEIYKKKINNMFTWTISWTRDVLKFQSSCSSSLAKTSFREPLGQYSVRMNTRGQSTHAPMNRAVFSCATFRAYIQIVSFYSYASIFYEIKYGKLFYIGPIYIFTETGIHLYKLIPVSLGNTISWERLYRLYSFFLSFLKHCRKFLEKE